MKSLSQQTAELLEKEALEKLQEQAIKDELMASPVVDKLVMEVLNSMPKTYESDQGQKPSNESQSWLWSKNFPELHEQAAQLAEQRWGPLPLADETLNKLIPTKNQELAEELAQSESIVNWVKDGLKSHQSSGTSTNLGFKNSPELFKEAEQLVEQRWGPFPEQNQDVIACQDACVERTNMKTAIVIIPYPFGEGKNDKREAWSAISSESDKRLSNSEGVVRIDPHLWQIDVASDLLFLCWLIHQSNEKKLEYRVAFMDEPPKWIESK